MVMDSIYGESAQLSLSRETPNSSLSMTLTNTGVGFVQADRMGELVDPHPDTIPLKPTSLAEAQMFVRWLTLGLAHMESLVKKDWESYPSLPS